MASEPVRIGVVGLGKMGISHLAILGAHAGVELVALCDESGMLLEGLGRYMPAKRFKKFSAMIAESGIDAVLIATPPFLHREMVGAALERGLGVFCEKPFTLSAAEADALTLLAERKAVANQVGYHNRFIASFAEAKRIVEAGILGRISHARAEAYGPVVLREKGSTWRSKGQLGGGCLYDYAAHPLDLLTWYFGAPASVGGSIRRGIFSRDVDDEVYSTLEFADGPSAHLSVNWSDESQRKMSTSVTLWGERGNLFVDRQELRLFIRDDVAPPPYGKGWNVRYTTELTEPVDFYLRGEEYSAQIDHFVEAVRDPARPNRNSFRSAAVTDRTIEMIVSDATDRARKTG